MSKPMKNQNILWLDLDQLDLLTGINFQRVQET